MRKKPGRRTPRDEAEDDESSEGILSEFGALCVRSIRSRAKVIRLLTQDTPDLPGKEINVIGVDFPPRHVDPMHRHDAHAVVYVLAGHIDMQVQGKVLQHVGPGQVFYESPIDIHTVAKNTSQTDGAKFIVFFLKNQGAPILTPAR